MTEQEQKQAANGRKLDQVENMITDLRQTYEETTDPEKELAREKPKMGQELDSGEGPSRSVYLFIAFVAVGLLAVVSVSVRLQMSPSSSSADTPAQQIDIEEPFAPVSTGVPLPLRLPQQGELAGPDLPPPLPTPPIDISSPFEP